MVDLDELRLDQELLGRLIRVHQGYAQLLSDAHSEQELAEAASSMVLAGVYSSLVRPQEAVSNFRRAAHYYRELNLPYRVVVAICGGETEILSQYWSQLREADFRAEAPSDVFYGILAGCMLALTQGASDRRNTPNHELSIVLDISQTFQSIPAGRMGLPNALYLSLGRLISENLMRQLVSSPRDYATGIYGSVLSAYLTRADEPVGAAMVDNYHWTRLKSGLMPVEPEVIATCIVFNLSLRQVFRQNLRELQAYNRLTGRQRIPIDVAVDLCQHIDASGLW
jgi:hypothetical protein